MILRSPTEHENTDLRHAGMDSRHPGWRGGVRRHPCQPGFQQSSWNDAIEAFCFKLTEVPPHRISKEATKRSDIVDYRLRASFSFVVKAVFLLYLVFGYMLSINTTLKSCQSRYKAHHKTDGHNIKCRRNITR